MNEQIGLDHYLSFINSQLQQPREASSPAFHRSGVQTRAITISRQAGSGAHVVAEKLAAILQAEAPGSTCPWTVFDRNLVEKVLDDHNLPARLAKFMPEDRILEMADIMDDLFGVIPSSWTMVRQTSDTILHLVELGRVIIIGRGANIITSKLDYVFHVRLVGTEETRIAHLQESQHFSESAAREFAHKEDLGRRRYIKKYFNKSIDDSLLYHLVINTDYVSYDKAARLIADAVVLKPAEPPCSETGPIPQFPKGDVIP